MSDRTRRELSARIDELEATIAELREELEPERGPMGMPRPPRPREMLRFTDEYAIPAAITALEANVRALELLRAGIRATDPERDVERSRRVGDDRTTGIGRASLGRLERALSDLETAVEDSGMPGNREARDLVADARRLNEEIREAMEAGGSDVERRPHTGRGGERAEAVRIEVVEEGSEDDAGGADDGSATDDDVAAEVEAELETVKEEVESEEEGGDEAEDAEE